MINSFPSKIESLAIPNSIKDDTKGSQDLLDNFLFNLNLMTLIVVPMAHSYLRPMHKILYNKPYGVPL